LLATDLTPRKIGRNLCPSQNTVKSDTRPIYRKLGVVARAGLAEVVEARGDMRLPAWQLTEGHVLRFEPGTQRIVGLTVVNARWLLHRDGRWEIPL
jgi:hypothetical protein